MVCGQSRVYTSDASVVPRTLGTRRLPRKLRYTDILCHGHLVLQGKILEIPHVGVFAIVHVIRFEMSR